MRLSDLATTPTTPLARRTGLSRFVQSLRFESGYASAIQPILDACIRGPYRVVHHALLPYVAIAPADEYEPVVVTPGPCLRLPYGLPRILTGVDDRLLLVVMLEGAGASLADLDFYPSKRALAHRAIASIQPPRALPRPPRTLTEVRRELISTLQATVAWMARMQAQEAGHE